MNICITGLDYPIVKQISLKIAESVGFVYIDADDEFQPILLKSTRYPTALVDSLLQESESKLLKKLSKIDGIVSVPADMFLSNNNSKIFVDSLVIGVFCESINKTDSKIQELVREKCKYFISTAEDGIDIVRSIL